MYIVYDINDVYELPIYSSEVLNEVLDHINITKQAYYKARNVHSNKCMLYGKQLVIEFVNID